jgi:hypothetical protein
MRVTKMGVFKGNPNEKVLNIWMWTGDLNEYTDGSKQVVTSKVGVVRDIAKRYWLDDWIPVEEVTDELLRKMEVALQTVDGGFVNGERVPDGQFLEKKIIPSDYLLPTDDTSDKELKTENNPELDLYIKQKQADAIAKLTEVQDG